MQIGRIGTFSIRLRRESYQGTWLPEPVLTGPGPEEHAELADSLSMAFLVVLESLSPAERAVFLLHEVFGYEHKEIAEMTGTSSVNSRQILARARRYVDEGKPRFAASRAQREEVARRFFAAAGGGDLGGLLRALAPDVVYYADGGGKARAAAAPLHGRDRVARFLAGLFRRIRRLEGRLRLVEANGQPGAVTYDRDGHVLNVFALDIADGQVQAIRCVVNPDKLRHLGQVSELARKLPPETPLAFHPLPASPGARAEDHGQDPERAGRRPRAGSIPGTGTGTVGLTRAMARILVTGATGNVGREVTTQLVSAGFPVRAFVRDARTARFPEGVEVAEGDLSAPETLGGAVLNALGERS